MALKKSRTFRERDFIKDGSYKPDGRQKGLDDISNERLSKLFTTISNPVISPAENLNETDKKSVADSADKLASLSAVRKAGDFFRYDREDRRVYSDILL